MEWPYRRFVKAFDAFQRRTLCDEWRQRRITHVAALHANTNWDSEENDRETVLRQIEQGYEDLIAQIWNGPEAEETVDLDADPFMRAGRRNLSVALESIQPPEMPGENQLAALPGT